MCIKWSDLFAQGSLVDTCIRQCRFNRKLEPQDVGLKAEVETEKIENSEKKKEKNKTKLDFSLIQSDEPELKSISSSINKVKKLIDGNSLYFPLVEGARYIPKTRVGTVITTLTEIRSEFDNAVNALADKYQDIRDRNIARLRAEIEELTKGKENASELTEEALTKLLNSFPNADDIRRKFNVSWKAFSISAPVNQETAEAIEAETETVKSVVKDMVGNLRQQLIEEVNHVLKLAEKNKEFENIHGKTREAILDTCTKIKELNILGDDDLNATIDRLTSIVDSDNSAEVLNNLKSLKTSLEGSLESAVKTVTDKLTSVGKRALDFDNE